MKASEFITEAVRQRLDPKCWKGKHKEGTKIKGGVRVNNCVPNESVEEARAIIKPEDGIAALKKFSAYLKKNIVDLASMADFEAEHSKQPYVDERFEGFLTRADGTPVTPIFNLGGKLALVGPNKNYLNIPTEMYYSYRGFMYGGVLENELMKILGYNNKGVAESKELSEEFDLIESAIDNLALRNGVDSEVIWEDLESLTDDELYVFAVTQEPIMESITESRGGNYEQMGYRKSNKDKFALLDRTLDAVILTTNNLAQAKQEAIEWAEYDDIRTEVIQQDIGRPVFTVDGYAGAEKYLDESEAWQKANNKDKTDGMSRKAVKAYRREHPGSKLQTAVTTKPGKLKKGSKASKRRKSYCSRSKGQMKMHNISCAKTPDKAICKARRRWNC